MKVSAAVLYSVSHVAALGAALSLVFCGVTYGTASLMSRLAAPDQRSETKLAESIANAREIRAALPSPYLNRSRSVRSRTNLQPNELTSQSRLSQSQSFQCRRGKHMRRLAIGTPTNRTTDIACTEDV